MFGKKRREQEVQLLTPDLIQLIAIASVELTAKNAAALERWGIGTADRWSADLAAGTVSFHFPDRTITGPVEVLGSYSSSTRSWLWGWANESLPEAVTAASANTRSVGAQNGLTALTEGRIDLPSESLADDFAAVSVELSELAGMYRAPTNDGFIFLGFTEFDRVEL